MSSMSTAYHPVGPRDWASSTHKLPSKDPPVYECKSWGNSNISFNSGLPTPPGSKAMPAVVLGNSYAGYPAPTFQHGRATLPEPTAMSQQYRNPPNVSTNNPYALVPPTNGLGLYTHRPSDEKDTNAIAPHLQIPESVNKSKGSLAEFAAEITCLFWFETTNALQYVENLPEDAPVDRGLLPDAIPSIGFRKWVTTIISTTQVGKNVILLALLFIYRLKKLNPTVSGKRGSEFRLLTVALMLGNKFLDDNTYTNKTWAEVSGISVTEIHIMEVEFLSNMRYALHASAEKWAEWKAMLGKFGAYYQKALQLPLVDESRANGVTPVTPTSQHFSQKLPSPPSTHHSVTSYSTVSALNSQYPVLPHPTYSVPPLPNSPLRQEVGSREYRQERKRSADYSSELPPAKRQLFSGQLGLVTNSGQTTNLNYSLPYPSTSLRQSPTRSSGMSDARTSPASLLIPRLDVRLPTSVPPPITHSTASAQPNRALSTVYPATTTSYSHPVTPISAVPQTLFQNSIPSLGESHRSITNYPSAHTSPSNGYTTTTPTLPGLSPSYFLTHRTSPYRPVRHVNTLLIPPPAAALQAPVRNVSSEQIHYQPLSKATTERRTGLLPFFQPEGWQNSNVSTPNAQQYHHF